MKQNNSKNDRKTGRSVGTLIGMLGGCARTVLSLAMPALGQEAPAVVHNAPAERAVLITEGTNKEGKVQLVMNKSTVLMTGRPYKSVSVGQPEIADVTPVSPTNILVTAKKPGTTQLIVWDENNRSQVADVTVAMDLDALQAQLGAMFPGTTIELTSINGALALRGKVPDVTVADQAVSAASAYGVKVLNFLEVGGGQQVMLQVRFAEVSREATSQLGVNFAMSDGIFSVGSNVGQVTATGFNAATPPGDLASQSVGSGVTLFGSGQAGALAFRYFIQALRQNNLLRVLAEPNLIAMSGQEASFLAGGEFPVPVPQSGNGGAATITIEYREFGVRLGFVPIVLGDGKIRLKMTPEVSDLDFSTPVVISGSRIPVVNKRKVTTMVELADGQTLAIAGLLNNNVAAAKDVTPILGDLPVLGTLFRSVRYQRKETELVVLVTPKLIAPLNAGQSANVPGEHWRHPSEAQLFLNQDLGSEQEIPVEKVVEPKGEKASSDAGSTTRPAIAQAPATEPATKPALAQATPSTGPASKPALAQAAPTTEPASKPALAQAPKSEPTTKPSLAAATTQPSVTPSATARQTIAQATTQPTTMSAPVRAVAIATPPSTDAKAAKAPIANVTVGKATPADTTPKQTSARQQLARNAPRYRGLHGFTPPSQAPPRGEQ